MGTDAASFCGENPYVIQTCGDGDGVKVNLEEGFIRGRDDDHGHRVADSRVFSGFDIEPGRFTLARPTVVGEPIPLPVLQRD